MTDYSPDYTFRYRTHYLAGGLTHDFTVRAGITLSGGAELAAVYSVAVGNFLASLEDALFDDFECISASWAYAGSDVFVPSFDVPANPTGVVDHTAFGPRMRASAVAMAGRAADGSKGRLYLFGYAQLDKTNADPAADGWISVDNDANLVDAKAIADTSFHTGSGALGVWYPRLTIKVNDRALRTIRRTVAI